MGYIQKTSIKKNIFYQMIYELLVLILPFLTSPYIARVIGVEGVGIYSYTYSIAYYFVLFCMLGIKNHGNREIAQCREDKQKLFRTFSELLTLHILISLICILFYLLYLLFFCENKLYAGIQGIYLLSALFDISWFYFGIEKFKLTVTCSTIVRILNVIFIFAFVHTSQDLWKYCLIIALGNLISQLALWIPLKNYVKYLKPTKGDLIKHIKPLLILFIPFIAVSLYKYMDKIMIGNLSGKIELGYYENAEKVINIPMTIITSFGTVMLPRMAHLSNSDESLSFKYISMSFKYIMCLAFALAFGLAGVGQIFAPVFWGNEFMDSGMIILGLSVTIPFLAFANIIRTQYLIPRKKDKEFLISVIMGAVVNLLINCILIPQYGADGATIGTIFAEIAVCLVQCVYVRKELLIGKYIKNCTYFFVIGFIMFIGVYLIGIKLGISIMTLFIQILAGGLFYCSAAAIYLLRKKDELITGLLVSLEKKLVKR